MKLEFTKEEQTRLKELSEKHAQLDKEIELRETALSVLRRERNRVFAEFCSIVNPDPLPFDKKLLPYGWD